MVRPYKTYIAVCDCCGRLNGNPETDAWMDKDAAIEDALSREWHKIRGKIYCPGCCEYNDNTDEYEPKNKRNGE